MNSVRVKQQTLFPTLTGENNVRTFHYWFRLLRLKHGLTASAATWLVAMLCLGHQHVSTTVIMASVAIGISCISASIFHYGAANRMYTRKGEVLTSGQPRQLVVIGTIGFLLSLLIGSICLSAATQAVLLFNFLAVAWYARWLSKHWATKNLTIALVLISPIVVGWLAADQWHPMLRYILAAVFCGYLARETIKDISDIKANHGLRVTLPIWIGIPGAILTATICLTVGTIWLVPLWVQLRGHSLAQFSLGLAILTMMSTAYVLSIQHQPKVAERRIEYCHLWLMASVLLYRFV